MASITFKNILNHSVRVLRRSEGALDEFGHPAITYTTLYAALSCHFYSLRGSKRRLPQGQEKIGDFIFLTHGTVTVQELDIVEPLVGIVGLTRGEVVWAKGIMDVVGTTHHLEAEVRSL